MIPQIPLLDHGYLQFVESWGSDERIIEAARMSTGKGFLGWGELRCSCGAVSTSGHWLTTNPEISRPFRDDANTRCPTERGGAHVALPDSKPGDEKLLRFLWENKHATPFEMAGLTVEVQAPIMVFREWHRHRTQCLAGDTMIHFESPKSERHGRRYVYKMPLAEVWRKWQPTVRKGRPERQENALWSRSRIANMRLRCANEETGEVVYTRVVDVVRGDVKKLLRVTTVGGKTIRASADHRFFTNQGWLRLEDAIARGALLAVERTAREMALSWEVPAIDETSERWRDVVGWEGLYEVSDAGRIRRVGGQAKRGTVGAEGYPVVNLNRPGVQQSRTVHSIVLEAWKGPRPPGHEGRHLNSNRIDARAINLEWGTADQNAGDRIAADRQQRLMVGFEEVESSRADGEEVTYDMAVADPWHNFVADGFVVHNSYNEMSARYIPLPDVNYVPTVERLMMNSKTNKQAGTVAGAKELTEHAAERFQEVLRDHYRDGQTLYEAALNGGVPKELARVHLPVGRYSRMRASANLRNWLAFLTLRMAPGAQWEIRQYANAIGGLIRSTFPRTWELFVEG